MLDIITNYKDFVKTQLVEGLEPSQLSAKLAKLGEQSIANVRGNILRRTDAYGKPFIIRGNPTPLIRSGAMLNAFYANVAGNVLSIGNRMPYSDANNQGIGVTKRTFLDAEVLADKIASQLLN